MKYRFPVYGRGKNGPVKLTGDADACNSPALMRWEDPTDVFLPRGWMFVVPDGRSMGMVSQAAFAGLVDAVRRAPVDAVVVAPWTRDRLPLAPGCNNTEMARRVYASGTGCEVYKVENEHPPVFACKAEAYQAHADMGVLFAAPTYRAMGAWVPFDGRSASPYDSADAIAKHIAAPFKPTQRQVVFVFREFPICGVTLAAIHICNGLNRRGWNATIACSHLDTAEAKLFPFEFGPLVYRSEDEMINHLCDRMRKDSVVVAPVHAMVNNAKWISAGSGARMIYYVQDDERRFKNVHGIAYDKPEVYEQGWAEGAEFGELVANSRWVAEMLQSKGHETKFVPIGVDAKMFKPSDKRKPPFRVVAHCRHSTPRRGWAFICAVLNQLAIRGLRFQAVTYDEEPIGLQVPDAKHLGRISPAEVAETMSGAHVFIEGSDVQGFGMQALEAMASGCALVCTDNRGIHTFGNAGKDCIVVRHGDVKGAADAIMDLAVNLKYRTRIGQAAREQAERFDWREVCEAWDRVLCERSADNDKEDPQALPDQSSPSVSGQA